MRASDLRARYWRIVFFFGRVTAAFIWWEIVLRRLGLGRLAARTRAERGRRTAVRFRQLAVSMGGLMIKVGQFLSARLDVLPQEITTELFGLQDEVPPEDFADIRSVAASELSLPLDEQFAWFDETPLAAASLGQVHRARLRASDAAEQGFADIVVKVQRPHIRQVIEIDLAALRRVGGWVERYRPIRERADVRTLIEEFASTTLQEIDYLAEAASAEAFAGNFADDPRVDVPSVVWELSGRRVPLQSFQLAKITTLSRSEALPNTWRHIDPCQTRFRLAFEAVHSGHFGGTPHESAVGSNLTKFGFLEALQQSREI